MSITQARELTRERLLSLQRRTPEVELRQRCRDLPRGRGWDLPVHRPEPEITEPTNFVSRILTPLSTPPGPRPLVTGPIPLLPELRRRISARLAPLALPGQRRSARDFYAPWLDVRPPAALVWTDVAYFDGEVGDILDLRQALDNIPEEKWASAVVGERGPVPPADVRLIRADMVLEPYQLFESHMSRADGVLCFAETLSREQLQELRGWSEELGLSLLVVVTRGRDLEWCFDEGIRWLVISPRDPFVGRSVATEPGLVSVLEGWRSMMPTTGRVLGWGKVKGESELERCAAAGVCGVVDPFVEVATLRRSQEGSRRS